MKKIVVYFIFIFWLTIVVLPLVWLFYTSLKSTQDIFASTWSLPHILHWENFVYAWKDRGIARYFLNSVLVTNVSLTLVLIVSSMASYVLGRFLFTGRNIIFYFFLLGLIVPTQLGIVPLFFLLNRLKLLDSYMPSLKHYQKS